MRPLLETVGPIAEVFYKADAALIADSSVQNVQLVQATLKNYREAQRREYSLLVAGGEWTQDICDYCLYLADGCARVYLEWLDTVIADLANPGSRVEEKSVPAVVVPPVPVVSTKARDQAFF